MWVNLMAYNLQFPDVSQLRGKIDHQIIWYELIFVYLWISWIMIYLNISWSAIYFKISWSISMYCGHGLHQGMHIRIRYEKMDTVSQWVSWCTWGNRLYMPNQVFTYCFVVSEFFVPEKKLPLKILQWDVKFAYTPLQKGDNMRQHPLKASDIVFC